MEEGGASSGVCAAAAWHRHKGRARVTSLRRTIPTANGLGPVVSRMHRRVRLGYDGEADVACSA
jgi:hypothetical protein